jgi:hypothetical protein
LWLGIMLGICPPLINARGGAGLRCDGMCLVACHDSAAVWLSAEVLEVVHSWCFGASSCEAVGPLYIYDLLLVPVLMVRKTETHWVLVFGSRHKGGWCLRDMRGRRDMREVCMKFYSLQGCCCAGYLQHMRAVLQWLRGALVFGYADLPVVVHRKSPGWFHKPCVQSHIRLHAAGFGSFVVASS